MDPVSKLAVLRTEIDEIDNDILELLARRQEKARAVARVKRLLGRTVNDPTREEEVLERLQSKGSGLLLSREFVSDVYKSILTYSKEAQREALGQ